MLGCLQMALNITFENTYSELPAEFYKKLAPEKAPDPKLIAWNKELASELKIHQNLDSSEDLSEMTDEMTKLFSGNQIHPSSSPLAMAYSGHQFGYFSPRLGDGRALLLGELRDQNNHLQDVQLKGSGRTPFSRSGDGKAPLGPVLREYIISEAMHHLGVPTTRTLAAVSTGETVHREQSLPGAVLTRVAKSHIRVGTFEYFASRGDQKNLQILLEYLAKRNYPELSHSKDLPLDFFSALIQKQADLVAKWMSLGFIHGVMNTDNTSAVGITIDYGPCAFLDETNFNKVFSAIDQNGRYAYNKQPKIIQWNMVRLAEALLLLYPEAKQKEAIKNFENELKNFSEIYDQKWKGLILNKIGLKDISNKKHIALLEKWLKYLEENKIDFTLGFRGLSSLLKDSPNTLYIRNTAFDQFVFEWKSEVSKQYDNTNEAVDFLNSTNPIFIPRNHLVEKTIQEAYLGDFDLFNQMIELIKSPYSDVGKTEFFTKPPLKEEQVKQTFCGT